MAEVRAHVLAHKAAVDTVRNELEKVKEQELEALRQQCDADLGTSCLLMLLTGRVKTIISHHRDASYAALDVHLINYIVFQKTTCICFPAGSSYYSVKYCPILIILAYIYIPKDVAL